MNRIKNSVLKALLALLISGTTVTVWAQTTNGKPIKPVKNVILMISDGTSLPVLSASRWMQRYIDKSFRHLNLDPYLSGTLITHSSNAPIGDSAPTTSCYVTGIPSITGFIATYPYSQTDANLFPLDSTMAYRPMPTVLELTRLQHNRKVGLVVTCEFCHATPADCSAHSYSRKRYDWIIPQMVHNNLDVVMGGGAGLLTPELKSHLESEGYSVFLNQLPEARNNTNPRTWQLYANRSIPYDIDRDTTLYPSLEEMTTKAIEMLSKGRGSENGFFLMVEGSKVDWAAHANDPVALISEFIAFDKAIGAAVDFAKKDGNTVVIVTSDHGNSGFSIGRKNFPAKYDQASITELFADWHRIQRSADGMAELLNNNPSAEVQKLFETYCGFTLSQEELTALYHCDGYKNSPLSANERDKNLVKASLYNTNLAQLICEIYYQHLPVGFTTHGHTGEDVFLAIYTPENIGKLVGVNYNYQLTDYMSKLLGIEQKPISYIDNYFAPLPKVLEGIKYSLTTTNKGFATLNVETKKGLKATLESFTNLVHIYKGKNRIKTVKLPLASVYVDKTNTLYVSPELRKVLLDN